MNRSKIVTVCGAVLLIAAAVAVVVALRNRQQPAPPPKGLAETLIAMIEGRPVVGFGRSGRAGVPPPAADGDGTPSLPARSRDTDGDGTPSLPGNTIHPPVVVDYCIQHLGAMVNELDDAGRKAVRGVLAKASGERRPSRRPHGRDPARRTAHDARQFGDEVGRAGAADGRFSPMYSALDFRDMLHMLLFYHGALYLTNGPCRKRSSSSTGCTLL